MGGSLYRVQDAVGEGNAADAAATTLDSPRIRNTSSLAAPGRSGGSVANEEGRPRGEVETNSAVDDDAADDDGDDAADDDDCNCSLLSKLLLLLLLPML
jgi:hypothetical protein